MKDICIATSRIFFPLVKFILSNEISLEISGVVLWELITRTLTGTYNVPYGEFPEISFDFQIIIQSSKRNLRPTIPKECPKPLRDLTEELWHQNPDKRPSCPITIKWLDSLIEQNAREPWPVIKIPPIVPQEDDDEEED
jgi:hypothetical protein